jgi:hypothetical protein
VELTESSSKGWRINNLQNFYIQLYENNNKLIEEQMFGKANPLCEVMNEIQLQSA